MFVIYVERVCREPQLDAVTVSIPFWLLLVKLLFLEHLQWYVPGENFNTMPSNDGETLFSNWFICALFRMDSVQPVKHSQQPPDIIAKSKLSGLLVISSLVEYATLAFLNILLVPAPQGLSERQGQLLLGSGISIMLCLSVPDKEEEK